MMWEGTVHTLVTIQIQVTGAIKITGAITLYTMYSRFATLKPRGTVVHLSMGL